MKDFKYVPTFESFTNEAKVELGHIDSGSMEDKWKIEQINDQLKGAIGKTCTFLDIISLAGHREEGVENRTSTASTPDSILKNIKCKILIIEPEKINLKSIFKTDNILYRSLKGKVQYAIIEL